MMVYKGIAITKVRLIELLYSELEYSQEEIEAMSEDEMIEAFADSGMFEEDADFAGIFDPIPDEYINFDIVSAVTGIPVSLDQFYEEMS